ncbi:MAG TPA: SRPBCC family protein [Flavobacteriaceae bacterium]|nr:SRPBCC family protein [Flavobacteriaceae bacterium]
MKLTSNKTVVNKSQEELFNFVTNLENFRELMPENISKFEVDGESFIFSINGMPEIRLVITDKQPNNKLTLAAASSKLDFTLDILINSLTETTSEVELLFNGDFNPMMAMMVKKPLQNFINELAENAKNL